MKPDLVVVIEIPLTNPLYFDVLTIPERFMLLVNQDSENHFKVTIYQEAIYHFQSCCIVFTLDIVNQPDIIICMSWDYFSR